MINDKGQFVKGVRSHPETEFKKGEHWRPRRPYWDRDWLYNEYVTKQRTTSEIAADFGITDNGIWFWLRKHGIKTRTMNETRAIKHWGLTGEKNGMYGVKGSDNPNWKGGCTPDRQALYCSKEWANACGFVWKRDKATCQRCGSVAKRWSSQGGIMHIHHIVSFSVPELRSDPENLVLLCVDCHRFVHSPRNINKEFIREEVRDEPIIS
jgi:hypothetical protein